jgi:hypothetical protein
LTNTIPQLGRIAIVQVSNVTVAYAQGYSVKESAKVITEYSLTPSGSGGDWPNLGVSGNKKATITIDALYVDNTYVTMFETGAAVTVICGPVGSSGGNPKDTYSTIVADVETVVKHENVTALKVSLEVIAAPIHSTW